EVISSTWPACTCFRKNGLYGIRTREPGSIARTLRKTLRARRPRKKKIQPRLTRNRPAGDGAGVDPRGHGGAPAPSPRLWSLAAPAPASCRLRGRRDALRGLVALVRAVERAVGGKAPGDADDLAPEGAELRLHALVADAPGHVEHPRRGRDRDDVRHGPG